MVANPTLNIDPDAPPSVDYMIPARRQISMSGNWANRLLDSELDPRALRPFIDNKDRSAIMQLERDQRGGLIYNKETKSFKERKVLTNDTNATLRTLDWIQLDEAVVKAAKPRLRAAKDIREAGLVYALPNGIAKSVLQFQQQTDISGATMSMDGLRQSESDRPVFTLINFPLPIIHKDFQFPLRQLLESRTGYSPLDTTTAELAGRRVAEQVEQLTLGTAATAQLLGQASYTYGGGTIQGYLNFTNRITYTITNPTSAGWIPQNTVDDILGMKKASQAAYHYGPWMVYFGLAWDPYMDDDYKPTYNDMSLRQRIQGIDGILGARTVDYIPDYSIVMVQMTTDVVRMVIGMDIMVVQWESHGGMQMNFKVMCVMVPQLRTDANLNTGIVHGNV